MWWTDKCTYFSSIDVESLKGGGFMDEVREDMAMDEVKEEDAEDRT